MSVPVRFHQDRPTCPIGDRPATSLSQFLPSDEPGKFLSLNCGDLRDILFTIHCRQSSLPTGSPPDLNFVCFESDPTVQARNLLILTLLADVTETNNILNTKIWNICYDLLIDGATSAVLYSQAFKLRKRTQSSEHWYSDDNEYKKFVNPCDSRTIERLRAQLDMFEKAKHYSKSQKKRFKDKFKSKMEECRRDLAKSSRAHIGTGPYWFQANDSIPRLRELYWSTGTTTRDTNVHNSAILPNPTLASNHTSSNFSFMVHPGVHPVDGFNLAPTYAKCKWNHNDSPRNEYQHDKDSLEPAEVRIAKKMFFSWAKSFRAAIKSGSVQIYIGIADPISACLALTHAADTNAPDYLSPWEGSSLVIEDENYLGHASVKYDAIDTGTLVDTMGYLNVLLMTLPLMDKTFSAAFFTRSSRKPADSEVPRSLQWNLEMDPNMFRLLIGWLPMGQTLGYTSDSEGFEVCRLNYEASGSKTSKTGFDFLVWKKALYTNDSDRMRMETKVLTNYLLSIFRDLFQPDQTASTSGKANTPHETRDACQFNTIGSFAGLLAVIKQNYFAEEWDEVLDCFLAALKEGPCRIFFQELLIQLHISGIRELLVPEPKPKVKSPATPADPEVEAPPTPPPDLFEEWKEVPEKVCVTLMIPVEAVDEFETVLRANESLNPSLHIQIEDTETHLFGCVFPCRAQARPVDFQKIPFVEIDEAPKRSLTVSTWVPSSVINESPPTDIMIRLVACASWNGQTPVTNIPACKNNSWNIFETDFNDRSTVFISPERPNMFRDLGRMIKYYATLGDQELKAKIAEWSLKTNSKSGVRKQASLNSMGCDIFDHKFDVIVKEDVWKVEKIEFIVGCSETPGSIQYIGNGLELEYPLPCKVTKGKVLDVCRYGSEYQGLIQITATPNDPLRFDNCRKDVLARFPYSPDGKYQDFATNWSLPFISLDSFPLIDVTSTSGAPLALPNLRQYWSATYVPDEFTNGDWEVTDTSSSGFRSLKRTIWTMFRFYTREGGEHKIFNLVDRNGRSVLVLFVNGIRLDVANNTVVLDCDLVVVQNSLRPTMNGILARPTIRRHVYSIPADDKQLFCWSWGGYAISIAERSRSWYHRNAECTVRFEPFDLHDSMYLCECASGKCTRQFGLNYKELAPFATRVAISPIFDWDHHPGQDRILARSEEMKRAPLQPSAGTEDFSREHDAESITNPGFKRICEYCGRLEDCPEPCLRCNQVWFCDSVCATKAQNKFHANDCFPIAKLLSSGSGEGARKKKKKKGKKKKKNLAPEGGEEPDDNPSPEEHSAKVMNNLVSLTTKKHFGSFFNGLHETLPKIDPPLIHNGVKSATQ